MNKTITANFDQAIELVNIAVDIKALLNLVPPVARIIRNGEEKEIPMEEVQTGDLRSFSPVSVISDALRLRKVWFNFFQDYEICS